MKNRVKDGEKSSQLCKWWISGEKGIVTEGDKEVLGAMIASKKEYLQKQYRPDWQKTKYT